MQQEAMTRTRTGAGLSRLRAVLADQLVRLASWLRPPGPHQYDLKSIGSLIDDLPIAVWVKNYDGVFLVVNRAHNRFFDLPPDLDLTGKRDADYFDAADVAHFRSKDRRAIDEGHAEQFYEPVHLPTRVVHLITLKFPLTDASGRRFAACGVCVDISEMVQLREQLERANSELRARQQQLLEISRSPAIDSGDLLSAMQLVTAAAREGLAVERAGVWLYDPAREALQCRWQQELPGPGDAASRSHIERARYPRYFAALDEQRQVVANDAARDPLTAELMAGELQAPGIVAMLDAPIRFEGETVGVLLSVQRRSARQWTEADMAYAGALADVLGRALGAERRARADVDLRQLNEQLESRVAEGLEQARRALAEAEAARAQLNDLIDSVPGGVYQFVYEGPGRYRVTHISGGMAVITGQLSADLLQNPDLILSQVLPEDLPALTASIETAGSRPDEIYSHTTRIRHAVTGEIHWISMQARGRRRPEGGLLFSGVFTDVSERARLQETLTEARRAAEAASKAKGDFLANMSHEIRTPLNAVLGLAQLLDGTALDGQQRGYLNKLREASRTLLALISNVLDLSKIEAGRASLELAPFRFAEVFDGVMDLFTEQAAGQGLALHALRDPLIPPVLVGDALRLRQVLLNLVSNALKFTERGEVRVSVGNLRQDAQRLLLRFSVRDTGIGVPQHQLASLFQPFVQADSSTSRQYGGTGLGLAICQQLVGLMGGSLVAESTPGGGSVFSFTARFGLAPAAALAPASAAPAPRARPQPLTGLRVLVAEDNDINLEIVTALLEREGVQVRTAHDGEAAVQACDDGWPQLLLMDMQMPGVDGLEASRRLRADPRHARLPIIALTANAMSEDRERCLAAGMNDHLAKPIELDLLLAALRRWAPAG